MINLKVKIIIFSYGPESINKITKKSQKKRKMANINPQQLNMLKQLAKASPFFFLLGFANKMVWKGKFLNFSPTDVYS